MLEGYLKWFTAHERLLIVLVLAIAGWYGWSKWLDKSADKALANLQAAKEIAETQALTNQKLAEQAQHENERYDALKSQTTAQIIALSAQIASRNAATEQRVQQAKVEALPLVAIRWQQLLALTVSDIQAVQGESTLRVSEPAARSTVAELEELPTVKANLADMTAQYANEQKLEAACESNTQTCQAEVAGLEQQIHDDAGEFEASEKALRATARRGKLRWFEIGAGGGSVATVILLGLVGVL